MDPNPCNLAGFRWLHEETVREAINTSIDMGSRGRNQPFLPAIIFLRTSRSFYESLWYLLTYLRTYVQVIFEGSHPTLKQQIMSEIIQVNVPIFIFDEIPKLTKLGPKKRFWDLKIKTNPSGSHPLIHPLFFKIHT